MSEVSQRAAKKGSEREVGRRTSTPASRLSKTPFIVLIGALFLMLLWGAQRHFAVDRQAQSFQEQRRNSDVKLHAMKVDRKEGTSQLELPGQTLAIEQARLFARATGYIAERRADIGWKVKKGELLARIAAPDLDQQLAQAKAQLELTKAQLAQAKAQVDQNKANLSLAKVTLARYAVLVKNKYESQQNYDQAKSNVEVTTANVAAAEANVEVAKANIVAQQATVDRLQQLTEFELVTAPFNGVVTARNIDTGDLVTADPSAGTPLYSLARDDVLRVQATVPQSDVIGLADGQAAQVSVPELPGRTYPARISRNAASLDPATRTLLVEIDIPNPKRELRPGLFVRVKFEIPRPEPLITVPAQAIIFRAEGTQVASIGEDGAVILKRITIARDFGTTVEVKEGLAGNETIALDPPADLREGQKVVVAP